MLGRKDEAVISNDRDIVISRYLYCIMLFVVAQLGKMYQMSFYGDDDLVPLSRQGTEEEKLDFSQSRMSRRERSRARIRSLQNENSVFTATIPPAFLGRQMFLLFLFRKHSDITLPFLFIVIVA